MQVIGFVTLLSGTMIYNELIKIPGLKYQSLEDEEGAAKGGNAFLDDTEEGYGRLMADSDDMTSLNGGGGRRK